MMTDNDFKNIEDIKRILKYLDKRKLDVDAWPNALKLKSEIDREIKSTLYNAQKSDTFVAVLN